MAKSNELEACDENEKYNKPCPYNSKVMCVQMPCEPEDDNYCDDGCPTMTEAATKLAMLFHETYEKLAPDFSYETRKDSAKPWYNVPEKNRKLMIAVASEILIAWNTRTYDCCSCKVVTEYRKNQAKLEIAKEDVVRMIGNHQARAEINEALTTERDSLREALKKLKKLIKQSEIYTFNQGLGVIEQALRPDQALTDEVSEQKGGE